MGGLPTVTAVHVHPDLVKLPAPTPKLIPVHLYGSRPDKKGTASLGRSLYNELMRLQARLDPTAFDFLSLSLAVTAADTFVSRDDAADGWARNIELTVALADPKRWKSVLPLLTRALNFLSGDLWTLNVISGGEEPPTFRARAWHPIDPNGCDSACLFSGGLDSAIGVLDLRKQGRNPILVSHAYTHDASRQEEILPQLGKSVVRFAAQASPRGWLERGNDVQMRTRSFNFLAMGVLMASCLIRSGVKRRTLFVPENGLIALNPPLTPRRIGALSTRTTHPYYIYMIQQVLNAIGIPIDLENPYAHLTKGQMMANCLQPARLAAIANRTVSCGKWKRRGEQCGRCVPCLIRRAAFHGAGMVDGTHYQAEGRNLQHFLDHGNDPDDLMAMLLASRQVHLMDFDKWVTSTGPMPLASVDRDGRVVAVRRGMIEVERFLRSQIKF